MSAVFRREFKSNLVSMTGAIFVTFILVLVGIYTADVCFTSGSIHFEYAITYSCFLSLLVVPVLTMRSFSEERHTKTDQLLYSLPISTTSVVMGKYLAMVAVFALPCALICVYPLIVSAFAEGGINLAFAYGSILAYFLLGSAVIAICMFISTLTESQVIAAVTSIGVILVLYFMASFAGLVPTNAGISLAVVILLALVAAYIVYAATNNYPAGIITGVVLIVAAVVTYIVKSSLFEGLTGKILGAVAVFTPIQSFANGVFDITAFVYYLTVCAMFAVFTVQSFEKRRWS